MKEYFECHITIDPTPREGVSPQLHRVNVEDLLSLHHWTFSEIHHDIILGVGPKMYATKHFNVRTTEETIWQQMMELKAKWESYGLRILRCKIERVLRDERYDK